MIEIMKMIIECQKKFPRIIFIAHAKQQYLGAIIWMFKQWFFFWKKKWIVNVFFFIQSINHHCPLWIFIYWNTFLNVVFFVVGEWFSIFFYSLLIMMMKKSKSKVDYPIIEWMTHTHTHTTQSYSPQKNNDWFKISAATTLPN